MKTIILDSGAVISLALNRILWVIERAHKQFPLRFCITKEVRQEIIDNPLKGRKFKLEALQVLHLVTEGAIEVISDDDITRRALSLLSLANSTYSAKGNYINLVHLAEISCIAACLKYKADAVMIDERTTRYLLEKPKKLENILRHRLHSAILVNQPNLSEILRQTHQVKFIRSAEFVAITFEKGLFNHLLPSGASSKETVLDALLWGLKINGCAISEKDLETLKREELKWVSKD